MKTSLLFLYGIVGLPPSPSFSHANFIQGWQSKIQSSLFDHAKTGCHPRGVGLQGYQNTPGNARLFQAAD